MKSTRKELNMAMKIIHLEDALKQANENAKKNGQLGVLPQSGRPSFRDANNFYARVRKEIENHS
jgi:hypothetical protein